MNIEDIKIGDVLALDDSMYYVVEYSHVKNATGGVILAVLKDVDTVDTKNITFPIGTEVEKVDLYTKEYLYAYSEGDVIYFTEVESKDMYIVDRLKVVGLFTPTNVHMPYTFTFAGDKLISIAPATYLDKLVQD